MASELLVAIDGSNHSERIVNYACDLAKSLSSAVILLYVAPASGVPEDFRQYAKTENLSESDYYDAVGRQILGRYSDIFEKNGIACEQISEAGNAAENILLVAKEKEPKLILLGLQGLHGLAKIRSLGSVSRRVIENSTVPVITVP